jgi:hypothetical protein
MEATQHEGAVARCPTCATPLPDSPVYCQRCNTPHHLDCWRFAAGCSIYACGGQVYSTRLTESLQISVPEFPLVEIAPPVPVRRPTPSGRAEGAVELEASKRQAFRSWLRELLEVSVTRGTNRRSGHRSLRLWWQSQRDRERRAYGKFLLMFLTSVMAVVVLLRWKVGAPGSILPFLLAYLGIPSVWFLSIPHYRCLTLDRSSEDIHMDVVGRFRTKRHRITHKQDVTGVAIWHEIRQDARGVPLYATSVILVDTSGRRLPILGGEESIQYSLGIPETMVHDAGAVAKFLVIPYQGVMIPAHQRLALAESVAEAQPSASPQPRAP